MKLHSHSGEISTSNIEIVPLQEQLASTATLSELPVSLKEFREQHSLFTLDDTDIAAINQLTDSYLGTIPPEKQQLIAEFLPGSERPPSVEQLLAVTAKMTNRYLGVHEIRAGFDSVLNDEQIPLRHYFRDTDPPPTACRFYERIFGVVFETMADRFNPRINDIYKILPTDSTIARDIQRGTDQPTSQDLFAPHVYLSLVSRRGDTLNVSAIDPYFRRNVPIGPGNVASVLDYTHDRGIEAAHNLLLFNDSDTSPSTRVQIDKGYQERVVPKIAAALESDVTALTEEQHLPHAILVALLAKDIQALRAHEASNITFAKQVVGEGIVPYDQVLAAHQQEYDRLTNFRDIMTTLIEHDIEEFLNTAPMEQLSVDNILDLVTVTDMAGLYDLSINEALRSSIKQVFHQFATDRTLQDKLYEDPDIRKLRSHYYNDTTLVPFCADELEAEDFSTMKADYLLGCFEIFGRFRFNNIPSRSIMLAKANSMDSRQQQYVISPEVLMRNYDLLVDKVSQNFNGVYANNEGFERGKEIASVVMQHINS